MFQLLLLVASWHRRVRYTAPLEVLIVGQPAPVLLRFLDSFGVSWKIVAPDPNDSVSKTSNTILGAQDSENRRILLVDNDVLFLADLNELTQVDSQLCMGAVAGSQRVNDAQWKLIEEHFATALTPTTRIPLQEHLRALTDRDTTVRPLRNVYVNGGVLLLPAGVNFQQTWRRCVCEIAELFHGHPLCSGAVRGSNMAGLATAISLHGKFEWLDLKYNYRPDCFALDVEPFGEIQIAHLTGVEDSHRTLTGRIEAFWRQKMMGRFNKVRSALKPNELEHRLASIEMLRDELTSLVREYDLEQTAEQLPRHMLHIGKSVWRQQVTQPLYRLYGHVLRTAARVRRHVMS